MSNANLKKTRTNMVEWLTDGINQINGTDGLTDSKTGVLLCTSQADWLTYWQNIIIIISIVGRGDYCIVSTFNTLSTNRNSYNRCKIIVRYVTKAKR